MRASSLLALVAACAPPPPFDFGAAEDLAILILYPEPGQVITLDDNCELHEVIVVWAQGLELVPPDPDNPVQGQGHWHGGPSLAAGYCVSSRNACSDYDGTDVSPGLLTLSVELQDNVHTHLGPEAQVEVELVSPDGIDCP